MNSLRIKHREPPPYSPGQGTHRYPSQALHEQYQTSGSYRPLRLKVLFDYQNINQFNMDNMLKWCGQIQTAPYE